MLALVLALNHNEIMVVKASRDCIMTNRTTDQNTLPAPAYTSVERPRLINGVEVAQLFGKPPAWFSRNRVRKALYARNFPAPVLRGRWLRSGVDAWLEREGKRPR